MKVVSKERMTVKCNHCNTIHETDDIEDFKESNTMPPIAHFMCNVCNQMASVHASDMPKRLFSALVVTVAKERSIFSDLEQFKRQKSIGECL